MNTFLIQGNAVILPIDARLKLLKQDKIILFYMDRVTKPMACFQDSPWFAP